ncbi:MAG: dienelactone hydrolase family protein, partial [Acetobacteraceae bacterium]
VPASVIPALKSALGQAGTKHTLEVYPGTHHGFCFPERAVYDTRAAEATWEKIFALWDRHLR